MEQFFWFKSSFPPGDPETNPKKNNFSTGVIISAIPGSLVYIYIIYIGLECPNSIIRNTEWYLSFDTYNKQSHLPVGPKNDR